MGLSPPPWYRGFILLYRTDSSTPLGENWQDIKGELVLSLGRRKAHICHKEVLPYMKRVNNLFEKIVSTKNLELAIHEVNKSHHWHKNHQPNKCTAWVELTKARRIKDLRDIIINGFQPKKAHISTRWDASAQKFRQISEPVQWPDQYVHHALIQVL